MIEKKIGIYMFTNTLKKNHLGEPLRYIGQSIDIIERYKAHKGRHSTSLMYEDFETLGFENFIFEILQECTKEELNDLEKYYIEKYNTFWPNGYNLTKGGSGYPTNITEITLERLRIANTGENNPMFGTSLDRIKDGNPMYNKRHTEESRLKIANRSRRDIHPMSKKVEDKSGRIWSCVKECAEFFNVQTSHLSSIIKGNRKVYHYLKHLDLHYLDDRPENYEFVTLEELEKIAEPKKIKNYKIPLTVSSPCGKKVIDKDGNIYSSVKECARILNLRSTTLNSFLLGVWYFTPELEPLGLKFLKPEHNERREKRELERKEFESKELSINHYKPKQPKEKRIIKISDKDGNIYNSVKDCAKHFEVRADKLSCMLNGTMKFYNHLVEYELKFI